MNERRRNIVGLIIALFPTVFPYLLIVVGMLIFNWLRNNNEGVEFVSSLSELIMMVSTVYFLFVFAALFTGRGLARKYGPAAATGLKFARSGDLVRQWIMVVSQIGFAIALIGYLILWNIQPDESVYEPRFTLALVLLGFNTFIAPRILGYDWRIKVFDALFKMPEVEKSPRQKGVD